MKKPKALVISGYGVNCEEETKFAFELGGAEAEIVHVNDLIAAPGKIGKFQIVAFPGGFSYGDDTGAGNAFAQKVRSGMWENLVKFLEGDHLLIGICNGFQVITNLGLVPAAKGKYGSREAALVHNSSARYVNRWVDLKVEGKSPWLLDLEKMSLPIAHGEGRFFAQPKILQAIKEKSLVVLRYVQGEMCNFFNLEPNPTGTLDGIAGVVDQTGKILGLMPHPERAVFFHQLPNFTFLKEQLAREGKKIPKFGPGLKIFQNAVNCLL